MIPARPQHSRRRPAKGLRPARARIRHRFLPLLFAVFSLGTTRASAGKITYQDDIYPVFSSTCLNCHNPDKKKGDLDLSTYAGTMAGSSGGKIVTPGDGISSKLYNCVAQIEKPKMPPEGEKLSKKETDLIRTWIDQGLLESKNSTAAKKEKPAFDLAIDPAAGGKPDGPPAMPHDLLLDPVVVATRPDVVADMEASPWAPLLALTAQKQVLLYNTDTLRLAAVLPFPPGMPETLSFHPGGRYLLAAGGIGGKSGSLVVWDITSGKIILRAGREFDSILAADLRKDLDAVSFGGPSRLVKLWDTRADQQFLSIKKHTDWVTALAYSPDGVLLATADRNSGVQVWEAASGNEFHTLRGHKDAITALAWRADSNLLLSASEDGKFIAWEMNGGKAVKKQKAHNGGILSLDYARNGQVITSGRDKKVKLWKPDFNLRKELPTFPHIVTEVAFSHDAERFFTADYQGKIEAWDSKTYKKIGELSANPPPVKERLARLQSQLTKLSEKNEKSAAAQKKTTELQTQLAHWQAAAINTEKLRSARELQEAEAQKKALDTEFKTRTKKMSAPDKTGGPEEQKRLIQLKKGIDTLASRIQSLSRQHKKLSAQYQESK